MQVLINLLRNAVKFTPTGSVALRVTSAGDDLYHFEVEDTGRGIDAEGQRGLFESSNKATRVTSEAARGWAWRCRSGSSS